MKGMVPCLFFSRGAEERGSRMLLQLAGAHEDVRYLAHCMRATPPPPPSQPHFHGTSTRSQYCVPERLTRLMVTLRSALGIHASSRQQCVFKSTRTNFAYVLCAGGSPRTIDFGFNWLTISVETTARLSSPGV